MKTQYKYTATDSNGNPVLGSVLCESKEEAFQYLAEQEYTNISI